MHYVFFFLFYLKKFSGNQQSLLVILSLVGEIQLENLSRWYCSGHVVPGTTKTILLVFEVLLELPLRITMAVPGWYPAFLNAWEAMWYEGGGSNPDWVQSWLYTITVLFSPGPNYDLLCHCLYISESTQFDNIRRPILSLAQ